MKEHLRALLETIDCVDEILLDYGDLTKVEVDEAANIWHLHLRFEKPVPVLRYRRFVDQLDKIESFVPSVKTANYHVEYDIFTEDDLMEYYTFVIDRLIDQDKRIMPLRDYETDVSSGNIRIMVPYGAKSASMFRQEIETGLRVNGFPAKVEIIVDEVSKTIQEEIDKTNRKFVQSNQATVNLKEVKYEQLYEDKPVENDFFPIKNLPYSLMDLEEYKAQNGNKANFTIRGRIVSIEIKDLRSGAQANIILSDGTDTITVKKRLRSVDEKAFLDTVKEGFGLLVSGYGVYDEYYGEVVINAVSMAKTSQVLPKNNREDNAPLKRVELHTHTKMSALDGVPTVDEYVDRAVEWGMSALAITDHGSVQSFPDFAHAIAKKDIKPIYGLELVYVDNDAVKITRGVHEGLLSDATFVVFDIETTGLSVQYDTLIEIAGVKIRNGAQIGEYQSFVNPGKDINAFTTELTGITNSMVKTAPNLESVLRKFYEFSKGCILVAHNAEFDLGHIYHAYQELEITKEEQASIDTLTLAKVVYHDRARYGLDALCKLLKVPLNDHHRAINDAKATTEVFLHMLGQLRKDGILKFQDLNGIIPSTEVYKYPYPKHINLLVQKQHGLKNLYKILSKSLTDFYDRDAKITKEFLQQHRDGLLVSSGCRNSDFFETAMNKTDRELREAAKYYDILEVQPPSTFSYLAQQTSSWRTIVEDVIRRIVAIGAELGKIVVATGDVHHLDPEDLVYREVMINTPLVGGGGFHKLYHEDMKPSEHFRTTEEMLAEFAFLGEETAKAIVVDNTNDVANIIDNVLLFPKELFAPTDEFLAEQGVPSIKVKVENMVRERAERIYGKTMHPMVKNRMEKELKSIIENQFSTVYYISHLLVKKSLEEGYLVGSRGSVGSSLVATLMDITEVNPLPPHYVCPKCHFTAFKKTEEEKRDYPSSDFEKMNQRLLDHTDCGFDLPDKVCPVCNTPMHKDGHDIPFETFLGFKGDKVPDIDLNFSGDYQSQVHEYIRKLFGAEYAFRAGTIGTCAAKTAYAMVRDFYEKQNEARTKENLVPLVVRRAEMERIAKGVEGSKRTSGQHPGGIVVVPNNKEIYDVTPIQYPGDSTDTTWKTTHYDYHSFESNLFKLDVLGHDDPTMIKYLMDLVKKNPLDFPFSDPKDIPVDDKEVYKLLSGTDVIGLSPEDIDSDVASYGIPEFGTNFVRGMLRDSRPASFSDLVKISGLSHGTDVWSGNAQDLITGRKREFGRVDFKDIIGCRDDIMVDLIDYGMVPTMAFEIMEFVRKGKAPANPEKWAIYADAMRSSNVPEWYIWSCSKIKYMFPKAHATAYVLMAMRIAWFKLYRPIYFYSAYFSKRANIFDVDAFSEGEMGIKRRLDEINNNANASEREKNLVTVLEIALEMTKRGFHFQPIDIHESEAADFKITPDKKGLLMPFVVIDSLGQNVASSIVEAREEKPFISKQDIKTRTKLSSTLFERLEGLGTFDGMINENQISLFDL
ncbi:MAG: PolC-type DNA polymerase III [Candidatus Izemoplasmatales bacterium]|nr:PolC-type DNA polymerase III [Candidatus Izemoplasmatales bacterium]